MKIEQIFMKDGKVIQTYVYYKDKCFFVSTIERDSSAMLNPGRYNETLVWEFNQETKDRGKILYQDSAGIGSIRKHQEMVEKLHKFGEIKEEEE